MLAIACAGGTALNIGLKLAFGKLRPQLWTQFICETSSSFPSGHALGSLVIYGFLAYLLATLFRRFALVIYSVARGLIFSDRLQSALFRRALSDGCNCGLIQ
jgi:membrane-associated phospholipid phosphatase